MPTASNHNIEDFKEKLLSWFTVNGRSFPWRKAGLTNYQLVVAEVLLQRTKAETVAKFYLPFIRRFPNWRSLSLAHESDIADFLKPIGLQSQRAKRLKLLANEMVRRNGRLPKDRSDLESIPFLGQYTANAVELMIFNLPSPLIDVNMVRVLERYFGPRKMADIRYDPYLQDLSQKVVAHRLSKQLSWAVLDFAAKICKAPKPLCYDCIFQKKCTYYRNLI